MNKTIIWKRKFDVKSINDGMNNTMMSHIGIKITKVGKDYIKGTMPFNDFTKQPFGILHGGASVTLAETLGSIAANLCIDYDIQAVGLEINANHIKPVSKGVVEGIAKVEHLGKKTQVWQIKLYNEGKLSCVSRLTMALIQRKVPS